MDHPVKLTPLNIPALMNSYGLHTDKRLGQNFLIDDNALSKIVQAAELNSESWVLEIGAGLGNLTRQIADKAKYVVAVEIDSRLIPALQSVIAPFPNVLIIKGDILEIDPAETFTKFIPNNKLEQGYCVVANIPYYITSAVIRHLLESNIKPDRIILTIQKEVAERICAAPGKMNLLSLSVQVYGKPQIISSIPAGAFYPTPKVDSNILRIDLYPKPEIADQFLDIFFQLIKAGFSQKRKNIRNAFKGGLGWPSNQVEDLLSSSGIDSNRRAETLAIPEWNTLCLSYYQSIKDNPPKPLPI